MTIEQANAVNVVLREVMDDQRILLAEGYTVDRAEPLIAAAALLADRAHRVLMAGLTGDEVRTALGATS